MRGFLLLLLLIPLRAEPRQSCRACHPAQAQQWDGSAHAHSLKPVLQSEFFAALPGRPIAEARRGFLVDFVPHGNALKVTSTREPESASDWIEWVVGAGRRAETPVTATSELRISYYRQDGRFDLTLGHRPGVSASAQEAIGMSQAPESMRRCFGCHSTGGMPGGKDFTPGVGCLACHPGASRDGHPHAGASAGSTRCEQCHRAEPEGNPDDPINVRYQAVRLKRSRCFASGKMSCVTCHNPHENARADAGWYRTRCLTCHPGQQDKGNCLECHMKRVAITARLVFTDHWIRTRFP